MNSPFINEIPDKAEAIKHLQKTWDELCDLRERHHNLQVLYGELRAEQIRENHN